MPDFDQFRKAAYFGELAKVKRMLAAGIDVNGLSSYKMTVLQHISAASTLRVNTYSAILLLLEAGANPLQLHDGNRFYKTTYPLFEVISERHLALARLYLWYIPADFPYLDIKVEDRDGYSRWMPKSDLDSYLGQMEGRDLREGKKKGFAECVREAGRDAQRATRLKAEAKEMEARGDNAGAGVAYAEVAALYAKHEKLERVLEYYWVGIDMVGDNALPEEYRPILVAHYRAKRLEFLHKARVCLERLGMRYPTPESIKAHAAVLEGLAGCREKRDAEFYALIERVAQILVREPVVEPVSVAAVGVELAAALAPSAAVAAAGGAGAKRTSDVSTLEDLSDHEAGEGEGVEESESAALLAATPAAAGAGDKPVGLFGMRQRKTAVTSEANYAETVSTTLATSYLA